MAKGRNIEVKILGDAKGAQQAFADVERAGSSMGSKVSTVFGGVAKAGAVMAAGLGAAVVGGFKLADAAGDLGEAQSKANVVFGDGVSAVDEFAAAAAKAYGMSMTEATTFAGDFGMLLSKSFQGEELASMSTALAGLSADLGSFNNMAADDVAAKLFSALNGEAEGVRAFGIDVSAAAVAAKAMELGLGGVGRELTETEKKQARYAIIMAESTLAQGDFARTSDGLANSQKAMGAQWENMQAQLGQRLAPAFAALFGVVADVMPKVLDWLGPKLSQAIDKVTPMFEKVVAWVKDNWPEIQATIQRVLERVSAVVMAFVELVQAVWEKWGDEILAYLKVTWTTVSKVVESALKVIEGVIKTVTALISGDWKGVWEGIKTTLSGVFDGIRALVSGALQQWWALFKSIMGNIVSTVGEKVGEIVAWFAGLPGKAVSALLGLGSALLGTGRALMNFLWDGLKDVFGGIESWLIDKVNWVANQINRALPGNPLGTIQTGSKSGGTVSPSFTPSGGGSSWTNPLGSLRSTSVVQNNNINISSPDPRAVLVGFNNANRVEGFTPGRPR